VQGVSSRERREERALTTYYDFEVAVILHAPDGVARTCGSSIMMFMLFRLMSDNKGKHVHLNYIHPSSWHF
jgi:hypothetical protein